VLVVRDDRGEQILPRSFEKTPPGVPVRRVQLPRLGPFVELPARAIDQRRVRDDALGDPTVQFEAPLLRQTVARDHGWSVPRLRMK